MGSSTTQKKNKIQEENKLYFCKLCGFIAESYEELDMHYTFEHDPDPDLGYELEVMWENKKKKKAKTLKDKALQELKLLIEGRDYHNEYVGWCTVYYEIYSKKLSSGRYIIKIRSTAEVC
ncbi:hypothetical protein [Sulfolobus monocaudavirus SMV3]|uniref:hypothetical protein n=1 Tax=Sulfolobus monocaudavirus SMV3 TaxID=1732177 RepID=UPI00070653D9|nr:hypothetical protein AXI69_gp47 [Sulfolobus monocaudavirus SMV3]ALG96984.1 hypothetical protein [Sulfolobus monocaudavirus SMV3]